MQAQGNTGAWVHKFVRSEQIGLLLWHSSLPNLQGMVHTQPEPAIWHLCRLRKTTVSAEPPQAASCRLGGQHKGSHGSTSMACERSPLCCTRCRCHCAGCAASVYCSALALLPACGSHTTS